MENVDGTDFFCLGKSGSDGPEIGIHEFQDQVRVA
jgi:hypothetical protein